MDFLTKLALAGAAVLFAAWIVLANRRQIARFHEFVSRIPRSSLSAFLAFAIVATLCAQKPGGTNAPPQGAGSPLHLLHFYPANPPAPLFRLESESTNETYSYAMPTNGVRHENWWRRGAYEDVFRHDLGGQLFPFGTNLCDSLWIYSWGMAGVRLGDASNRIVAAGVPMSAVPQVSQFWSAETEGGGRLLTWENFFLNRDTNTPVSAQLELMPSGDFIARSNLVESVYRRVNPDDWDDDGIPNEEDVDLLVYDGDNFGPHQELPEGANTNHYYWVGVVVSQANARVTFEGDGYSHLPDPVFIARAGDTNRVVLLLGKPHDIHCNMPVRIVGKEDVEVEVLETDGNLGVVWPVSLEFVPLAPMRSSGLRSHGASGGTTIAVHPERASGGNFSWPDNFCCYSLAAGVVPVFDCDGTCGCGGCSTGIVTYEVGGHEMSFCALDCGCPREPDPEGGDEEEENMSGPSVSVEFSKNAIIFEESYVNMPGDVRPRQSTDSELTCEVYGGTNGGHYAFSLYDGGRLARKSGSYLPRSGTVKAGETFRIKIKYEALAASIAAGDIYAEAIFTENETGRELTSETTLTAVMVEVVAHSTVIGNTCVNRHLFGPQEKVTLSTFPLSMNASLNVDKITNATSWCAFDVPSCHSDVQIQASCSGITFPLAISVVEPTHLMATSCRSASNNDWLDRAGSLPSPNDLSVGMVVDLRLMPDYVSFENVFLQEGFCMPTNVTGFFAPYVGELKPHDVGAGAWREVEVGEENYAGEDFASTVISITNLEWAKGGVEYQIPVKWYVKQGAIPAVTNDFGFSPEVFALSPNGDFSVNKFGCTAVRSTNGVTTATMGPTTRQ